MNPGNSERRNSPLVTIILCTYNRGHLITRAIASVLAQSYRNWELIIVDDGSTDETVSTVMPIVRSDPRITYCSHANQGLAQSRNVGIALARGTYTTFLDSDDEYRPGHLSVRVKALENHPSLVLVHGGIEYVGPVEKQCVADVQHPGKKIHLRKCYAAGTFFARTSTFRELKGFRNLSLAMDLDFIQRTQKKGWKIAQAKARTYRYHLEFGDRLCELYAEGGEEAILKFRRR